MSFENHFADRNSSETRLMVFGGFLLVFCLFFALSLSPQTHNLKFFKFVSNKVLKELSEQSRFDARQDCKCMSFDVGREVK